MMGARPLTLGDLMLGINEKLGEVDAVVKILTGCSRSTGI